MVGVKNQTDIKHACVMLRWFFTLEHVKKVGGDIEAGIWSQRLATLANSIAGRHDGRKLGSEFCSRPDARLSRKIAGARIIKLEC